MKNLKFILSLLVVSFISLSAMAQGFYDDLYFDRNKPVVSSSNKEKKSDLSGMKYFKETESDYSDIESYDKEESDSDDYYPGMFEDAVKGNSDNAFDAKRASTSGDNASTTTIVINNWEPSWYSNWGSSYYAPYRYSNRFGFYDPYDPFYFYGWGYNYWGHNPYCWHNRHWYYNNFYGGYYGGCYGGYYGYHHHYHRPVYYQPKYTSKNTVFSSSRRGYSSVTRTPSTRTSTTVSRDSYASRLNNGSRGGNYLISDRLNSSSSSSNKGNRVTRSASSSRHESTSSSSSSRPTTYNRSSIGSSSSSSSSGSTFRSGSSSTTRSSGTVTRSSSTTSTVRRR